MKRVGAMLAASVVAAALALSSAQAQQARNLAEFCGVWLGVCNRTCPTGPGNCQPVCAARRDTCMSTKCFPFNRPGPRCFTNAADRAATDAARAPNPQRQRARRRGAQ